MAEFVFIDRYRHLQPGATREIITARQEAFNEIMKVASQAEYAVNLARIAFGLPHPVGSNAESWFSAIMKAKDDMFSIEHDREEAARVASLVLSSRISAGSFGSPLAVLSAFFAGHRQSPEATKLADEAKTGLAALVRKRGTETKSADIKVPAAADFSEVIVKYDADGTTVKDIFDAVSKDYTSQIKEIVTASNTAITGLRAENRRLAEEVDLLWWHLSGHSFLLDQSLDALPPAVLPLIIGMDTASMVNQLPGPYGSYGIIRKTLGAEADSRIKLSEMLGSLNKESFAGLVTVVVKDTAMAPIHAAVTEIVINGSPLTEEQFAARTKLTLDVELSNYDFALQAYHERLLLQQNWVH